MPITTEQAKIAAAAAVAEAMKNGWRMAITVVEPSGDLVYFEKMAGTQYASVPICAAQGSGGCDIPPPDQDVRRTGRRWRSGPRRADTRWRHRI